MIVSDLRRARRIRNSEVQTDTGRGGWDDLRRWLGAEDGAVTGSRALRETTVYTCIKILAETVAKLPVKVYHDAGGGKRADTKHPVYSLLKLRPNPYMSAMDFWRCLEVQRNIYGNAYAWIEAGKNGQITGLYPLDSRNMKIYVDDCGVLSSKNKLWYVYTDDIGHPHKLHPEELLHFKGLTIDGLAGLSPIEALRMSIENAKASGKFLNASYKKGLTTSGIVHYIGDLDQSKIETFREKFEKMAAGLKNVNRISMLPLGYTFQPIELKMTDAQFLENARFTIQQLTAAYGIKPHQVNDPTKTSYASTSEANREFYSDTLLAILTMYEQELTYKLFLSKELSAGYYVRFNADVILRADAKARMETYAQGVQNMLITPNEARALEEREAKPGGDILYGNAALAPATLLEDGVAYKNKGG